MHSLPETGNAPRGPAFCQVDGLNFALKESDMTQHLADGIDNVGKVKVACRDFV